MRTSNGIRVRGAWPPRRRTCDRVGPRGVAPLVAFYWRRRRRLPAISAGSRVVAIERVRVPMMLTAIHQQFHATLRTIHVRTPGAEPNARGLAPANPFGGAPSSEAAFRMTPHGSTNATPRPARHRLGEPRATVRLAAAARPANGSGSNRRVSIRFVDRRPNIASASVDVPRRAGQPGGAASAGVALRPRGIPVTRNSRDAVVRPSTLAAVSMTARRQAIAAGIDTARRPNTAAFAGATPEVPMTWRATHAAAPDSALPGMRSVAPSHGAPAAPAPLSVAAHVDASARPRETPGRAQASVAGLDAAAVDRLTDTVIQRIERRARIERERRGL